MSEKIKKLVIVGYFLKQKKKKKKERSKRKKKEHNERLIKDGVVRDIRTLFQREEDYYKPKRVNNFCVIKYIMMQMRLLMKS